MKSTLIWLLLAGVGAVLLLGDTVDAWNRQFFNRYSRSWLRNNADGPIGGGAGGASGGVGTGMGGSAGNVQQIDDFNALFGLGNDVSLHGNGNGASVAGGATNVGAGGSRATGGGGAGVGFATYGAGYDVDTGGFGGQQQVSCIQFHFVIKAKGLCEKKLLQSGNDTNFCSALQVIKVSCKNSNTKVASLFVFL